MTSRTEREGSITSTTSTTTTSTGTLDDDLGPFGQTGQVREMANALFELSQAPCPSGGCSPVDLVDSTDSENNDNHRDTPRAKIHEDSLSEDTISICGSQDKENRPPLCDVGSFTYTLTLSVPNGQKLELTGTMSLPHIRGAEGQGNLSINLHTTMGTIELGWNMTFTERQSIMSSQDNSRGHCSKSTRRPGGIGRRRRENQLPGFKSTGK